MTKPEKGSSHLRRGRTSLPGAEYFLTICSRERRKGLAHSSLLKALHTELASMEMENVLKARAFVIMPDHIHLLFILGEELELSKVVARLKSKLTPALKNVALGWQAGFHDHRVRAAESLEPYFRYIHLNPYEAQLTEAGAIWPFTWVRTEDWEWFESLTDEGKALPEWLGGLP